MSKAARYWVVWVSLDGKRWEGSPQTARGAALVAASVGAGRGVEILTEHEYWYSDKRQGMPVEVQA